MTAPRFSPSDWALLDRLCAHFIACDLRPDEVPVSTTRQPWSEMLDEIETRVFDSSKAADDDERHELARHHGYVRVLRFTTRDNVELLGAIVRTTVTDRSSSWLRAYGNELLQLDALLLETPLVH